MAVDFHYGGLPPAMMREMARMGNTPSVPDASLDGMQAPSSASTLPDISQYMPQQSALPDVSQFMPQPRADIDMSGFMPQAQQGIRDLQSFMPQQGMGVGTGTDMSMFMPQQTGASRLPQVDAGQASVQNMVLNDVQGGGKGGNVAQAASNLGKNFIGNSKYVWGGGRTESDIAKGRFDCSSFVHHALKQAGKDVGKVSETTTQTLVKKGKKVNPDEMQAGDMIFFDTNRKNGHVGIYLGDGKWIGAQGSTGVAVVDMNESKYWNSRFKGEVRRV